MDLQVSHQLVASHLEKIKANMRNSHHRCLVVISGQESWVRALMSSQCQYLNTSDNLIVHSLDAPKVFKAEHTSAKKITHYLGTEFDNLIWDGFDGISPEGFGAATGLIKRGGLMFLLLPPLNKFLEKPDPDYLRMCNEESELTECGTRFLARMVQIVKSDPGVVLIEQGIPISLSASSEASTDKDVVLPTQDQQLAITAIESVSSGHKKRPLVMYADRGRGKSSVLGLAAARITEKTPHKIIITAPSKLACERAFVHFNEATTNSNNSSDPILEFVPPDKIIDNWPSCHLLLIDEAAAIPSPILKKMLTHYPRVVFSSTVHGYEGNGQGFWVRFRSELDTLTPQWKSLELKQPVRWANNDPLERFCFDFLLLDAEIQTNFSVDKHEIRWLDQDEMAKSESLLRNVISLLVTAHYQTSPYDIRLILDHHKIHIAISETIDAENNRHLVGVILLVEEGGSTDTDLSNAIFEGRRRPRGHLAPQLLVQNTGESDFLAQSSLRIMRIAIHPEHRGKGLGSELINAAKRYSKQKNIDSLTTCFGLTPELVNFWRKNQFSAMRVGTKKDGASGTQSAVFYCPISEPSKHLVQRYSKVFKENFPIALCFHLKNLSPENIAAILLEPSSEDEPLTSSDLRILHAYSSHFRPFDDSLVALRKLVLACFRNHSMLALDPQSINSLIIRVLQGKNIQTCIERLSLEGKKSLDKLLRASTLSLLENNNQLTGK